MVHIEIQDADRGKDISKNVQCPYVRDRPNHLLQTIAKMVRDNHRFDTRVGGRCGGRGYYDFHEINQCLERCITE